MPRFGLLALLAIGYVVLNACKPVHMDDAYFWRYAKQIAGHPLDPYGFSLLFYDTPVPANHTVAPPVFLYWWAGAIAFFGDSPFLWKLWLLPLALVLVASLDALCRRFCRGIELPIVCLLVLSPALLPSLNLMTDVPALALGLAAVALTMRAVDHRSVVTAIYAGAVAGLAMQTKYTAFVVILAMLLYAATRGEWQLWLLAAFVALLVFASWEMFTFLRYGESHFLYQVENRPGIAPLTKWVLLGPLIVYLGGLAPTLVFIGFVAAGVRRGALVMACLLVALGYAIVAYAPGCALGSMNIDVNPAPGRITWNQLIFGSEGILALTLCVAAAWSASKKFPDEPRGPIRRLPDLDSWFLLGWLACEVAGYFILSPFPATRRMLGIVVVATLLLGRWAARTCRDRGGPRPVHALAAFGILLGLAFYGVDLREAMADRDAVAIALERIRREDRTPRIWYAANWGFEFYAERAGMRQFVPQGGGHALFFELPGRHRVPALEPTKLRKGDWVVIARESMPFPAVERIGVGDDVPLQTVRCYYAGYTPIEQHRGYRVEARIARIRGDVLPVR